MFCTVLCSALSRKWTHSSMGNHIKNTVQWHLYPLSYCAVGVTLICIWLCKILHICSPLWRSLSLFFPSCHALFFIYLCSKCHPPPLRVVWSPFCCPSCAWSWSSTPADVGANAVASLSPKRVPARRQLMRSTTSPQCWWEDRPVRAWGTHVVRGRTPVAHWASGKHQFWMGKSMVWLVGD